MVGEARQFYIIVNGVKIAKREDCQWTGLVPGYSIEELDGCLMTRTPRRRKCHANSTGP
jgi:hypothetical protein